MSGMKSVLGAIAVTIGLFTGPAVHAQQAPVVVELFTSQGCSSCPPADKLFRKLATRDDVIALALHVDYWDYIGWKDVFADPRFTKRQKTYAVTAGRRSVYTPQMIINGQQDVVGTRAMEVADLIMHNVQQVPPVQLALARAEDGGIEIAAEWTLPQSPRPMVVQLVHFMPEQTVHITRGENAGETLPYTNIVNNWQMIGEWDGAAPLRMRIEDDGAQPLAVLIQIKGQGPIVGAAKLVP